MPLKAGSAHQSLLKVSHKKFLRNMSNILASFPMGSGRGVKITNYFYIDKELVELCLIFQDDFKARTWTINDSRLSIMCTRLFISPSWISELDCATTKTDTAERRISIGRESLQVFFCTRGLGVLPGSNATG